MQKSYYIPSNKLKGENRILYIFTGKSLIYTAIGAGIGALFYLLLVLAGLKNAGIVVMVIFAVIGYAVGTIKMPTSGNNKIVKNVGGDSIDEIVYHYIMFRKSRKVYSYAVPRQNPDYSKSSVSADLLDRFNAKVGDATNEANKTNEEGK